MLDHKPLYIDVGYLASFTIKCKGSSEGAYTVYILRKFNETHTWLSNSFNLQIKAKMSLLKHVSSTSESYFSAPY